jgi:hypothetical protein
VVLLREINMRALLLLIFAISLRGAAGSPCQLAERDQALIFSTVKESWFPEESLSTLHERLPLKCAGAGGFTVVEIGDGRYLIHDSGKPFPRWSALGVKTTGDPFDSVREYLRRYLKQSRIGLWRSHHRASFNESELSEIHILINGRIEWSTLQLVSDIKFREILHAKLNNEDQAEMRRLIGELVRKHLCVIGVMSQALISADIPSIGVADEKILVKIVYQKQSGNPETAWLSFYVNSEQLPFVSETPF